MLEEYKKFHETFEDMDKTLKQVDLTSILSVILDTAFPYSNLGVFHPIFA